MSAISSSSSSYLTLTGNAHHNDDDDGDQGMNDCHAHKANHPQHHQKHIKHHNEQRNHSNNTNTNNNININNGNGNAQKKVYENEEEQGLQAMLYYLCHAYKNEIQEASREIGRRLDDKSKYTLWNLRSGFMAIKELRSDTKIAELLSLHFHTLPSRHVSSQPTHKEQLFYFLDIQINDKECIHVRIYVLNSKYYEVQTIKYMHTTDKLVPF